jgi:hypothetical protein
VQVHAESAEKKEEWLKCLSDGGAFVPTIKALNKLGDAKNRLGVHRLGVHRRKKDQEAEAEVEEEDEEDSD